MFVPLHVKCDYSAGYGTASVEVLCRRAAEYGYPALALTDVENLYGQVRFHAAAREYGIKPITGVELRAGYGPGELGRKSGRLVLLARNRNGYESLCRIITARRSTRGHLTEDPLNCLEVEPKGLYYLSDDESVLRRLLKFGVDSGDVRYLHIRPEEGGVPPRISSVASTDAVMLDSADRELHVLQVAIRLGVPVSQVRGAESEARSLPTREQANELFHDVPESVNECQRIADSCTLDLFKSRPLLPHIALAGGESADEALDRITRYRYDSGRRAGKWRGTEYTERLERELATLKRLGLAGYFLIVSEIVDTARREGIAVAGRGSAASSLVAHVLGLTAVDPIRQGLLFERFIHSDRRDYPDIDLDLPSERRDALIEWVFRRFGRHRVAMVSAHQTFQMRSAFREGLKALGMELSEVERFSRQLPATEIETESPPPIHLLPERFRAAVPLIQRLVGKFHYVSVHPGGVVIAEPRIDHYAPLERAPKGVLVTQFDMHSAAKLGLVKIDLLGNRALSAIQEALRLSGPETVIPEADERTIQTLRRADTVGCFQIETPAMRSTLRQLPIRGIEDVVAALAVVRPGAASGEAKAAFIRRARGEEPAVAPHLRLEPRLRETYGILLYEEDLMASISAMTGWPLERSDVFRSDLIASQDNAIEMACLQGEFVESAEAAGVSQRDAERVWNVLARFAAYTFNKAHAVSYGLLAWQTAYLKTHLPAQFACGVLNHYGGIYPLRTVAADFAHHGVRILPPDVNRSESEVAMESGAVRIGLGMVKRLTAKNRALLFSLRPFKDLADLLARVPLSFRELESLVLCGACDELSPLSHDTYPFAHAEVLNRMEADRADSLDGFRPAKAMGGQAETYRPLVRIRNELRFLGIYVTDHPMRILRHEAARAGCLPTSELASRSGQSARIAGIVAASRRLITREGKVMQYVTLEDEEGLVEAVLRPGAYSVLEGPIRDAGAYIIDGKVAGDRGDVHIAVSAVTPFHLRPRPYEVAD